MIRRNPLLSLLFLYSILLNNNKAASEVSITGFEMSNDRTFSKPNPAKKTVITDYICSSKGACSFLEILGKYAEDLGILEKFSKSIQFAGIGSMEYMEHLNPYAEYISEPRVIMPEILRPYSENINQEFYNIDYEVFKEMLLNQNTNECRSTYYPHEAWTIYKPDRFKTGLIKNMKKVKEMVKTLKGEKSISSFAPAMYDYRNLLNFRILDALNERKILKVIHKSKI